MSLAILSSYLAFNIPATRRDVAIGGAAAAVASAFPIPASAGLMFDPIGAYSMGGSSGATNLKPVKADPLRPNSGITLLREVFDGYLPDGGLLKWYEQHLADDFQAVFEGGKVKLDKQAWAASASPPLAVHLSPSIHACCSSASLAVTADLLKSFPDFTYTRSGPIAYADSPNIVVWTAVVKGRPTDRQIDGRQRWDTRLGHL